jgi:hypothetical protein
MTPPAYLLADLDGTTPTAGGTFHLTDTGHGAPEKFVLLSAPQKNAVHQFLLYELADVTDGGYESPCAPLFGSPSISAVSVGVERVVSPGRKPRPVRSPAGACAPG